jgi:hypothetical protein
MKIVDLGVAWETAGCPPSATQAGAPNEQALRAIGKRLEVSVRDAASALRRHSAVTPRGEAQAQRVEPDEAVCVALFIDRVLLEGNVAEAVEALVRTPADNAG